MRVLIIGGGIGGLALAAGLRKHDLDATVFERDTDLTATGGYHITLDPHAQEALAALVPEETMRSLRASAAVAGRRDDDVMWDWKGRRLADIPGVVDPDALDVDRITLRLLLADAAGDSLRIGRACVGVERNGETVTARFADGTAESGDILVGADGTHSAVARMLAAKPLNHPTGIIGVSGRTAVTDLSDPERQRLGVRSSFAIGPRGTALYAGYLDPVGHAASTDQARSRAITREPSFIWGAMFPQSPATDAMRALDGAGLRDATITLLEQRGWTRTTLELLDRTHPETVAIYRFNAAATKPSHLAPWTPGVITALGDAVHATPPTAGMGAGIAIRDAEHLVRAILEVRDGRPIAAAIGDYERAMATRGAQAIALAMKTVRQVLATNSLIGTVALRIGAPAIAAVQRARRR
jgi:2-polyprenyl-6-methoxyphenol hydroxylase-like FAD-dependent oxidoreductase